MSRDVLGAEVFDAPSGPLGLDGGNFKRVSSSPVVDRTASSKATRDPAPYVERGPIGDTHWLFYALSDTSLDTATSSDIGYARATVARGVTPTPADFVHQGVAINRTALAAQLGGVIDWLSPTPPVKVGDTYYMFVVGSDGFGGTTTVGSIFRFTAPSPNGPWALAGTAIAVIGGEVAAYDNSAPIYYPPAASWAGSTGPWVMTFMGLTNAGTGAHNFAMATAPTINGTWTRVTAPTAQGGPGLNLDSPALIVDGDRLLMMICTVGYYNVWYDVSDGVNAYYLDHMMHAPGGSTTNSAETGASSWGGGSLFRVGDDVYFAYQALTRAAGSPSGYHRTFYARWQPGRGYVSRESITMLAATAITGPTNINVPASIPMEATAIDIQVLTRKLTATGAVVANEGLSIAPGVASEGGSLSLFPQLLNANISDSRRVPITPDKRFVVASLLNGATSLSTQVFVLGYWR